MRCLYCGSDQSSVIDKRAVKSSGEVRRRRECLKCHKRFTTYERIEASELFVIKRDGRKELFDRNKLKRGLEKALEKRPAFSLLDELVGKIESRVRVKGAKEVESKILGKLALAELKKADDIAYLRFISVYRQFNAPDDFRKALQNLGTKQL